MGHEVLWVTRDCVSGGVLSAESLLSARQRELAEPLRAVVIAAGVPVQAVVTGGQQSVCTAVAAVLPSAGPVPCLGRRPGGSSPLVVGASAGAVGSYFLVQPFSLPYFNELAGGSDNGHDHFLGSNIDWGQVMLRLKEWMDAHPDARPLRLAYSNHIDPGVVKEEFVLPPLGPLGPAPADPAAADRMVPRPGHSVRFVRGDRAAPPDRAGGCRCPRNPCCVSTGSGRARRPGTQSSFIGSLWTGRARSGRNAGCHPPARLAQD